MAGEFTAIIAEIGKFEPDDLTALQAITAKYPDLDTWGIGQKALATKAQTLETEKSGLETRAQKLQSDLDEWKNWSATQWDTENDATKAEVQLKAELATVTQRLSEIEGSRPLGEKTVIDSDFAAIKAFIEKEGYVKPDALAGLTPRADLEKLRTDHNQVTAGFEFMYRNTAHLPRKFEREFGSLNQDFKIGPFIDFLNANPERVKDVDKAYEEFVAPVRAELAMKKTADDLAARELALKAKEDALTARQEGGVNPADSGSGTEQLGTLQARMREPEDKTKVNAPLGSGITAAIAAEMYRKGEFSEKPN